MNYKLINKHLKDLVQLRFHDKKRIKKEIINEGGEGEDDNGLSYEFFDIGLEE